MTRGKHSDMATRRREVESTASQIETYKAAVARLTAENAELRQKMAAGMDAAKATERALRAQIREGTSAQVAALESEVRRLREERDQSRAELKAHRDRYRIIFGNLVEYVRSTTQYDYATAREVSSQLWGSSNPDLPERISMRDRESHQIGLDRVARR